MSRGLPICKCEDVHTCTISHLQRYQCDSLHNAIIGRPQTRFGNSLHDSLLPYRVSHFSLFVIQMRLHWDCSVSRARSISGVNTADHKSSHLLEPASQFYSPLITKVLTFSTILLTFNHKSSHLLITKVLTKVLTFKSGNVGVAWAGGTLKQFKKYILK